MLVWIQFLLDCNKCGETRDVFFFPDEDACICSECMDQTRVSKAKLAFFILIGEQGGRVTGKYIRAHTPVECECRKGHKCSPHPSSIRRGTGMCRICAGRDPAEAERNFILAIANLGGKVLGQYSGSGIPVECICSNGHKCNPSPTHIQQGEGMCRACTGYDPAEAEKNFIQTILDRGGQVIGKYEKSNIPVECICPNGHSCNPQPGSIRQGQGMCLRCVKHDPVEAEENFVESITDLGGKVLGKYLGAHIPVECECPEGHKCRPYPTNIQKGQGMCSSCGLKSEPLCREIFESILRCDMSKVRPSWLLWENNRPLELDGYNEERKIAFEYQGRQHDEVVDKFHPNGPEDLESQQARDAFKAKACIDRGVRLICVPSIYNYRDPEAMKEYISKQLTPI